MNANLLKPLVAFVPAAMLFCGSLVLIRRNRSVSAILQLLGAGCLLMIVVFHVCEALQVLPSMRWGMQDSVGHYLDLTFATLGLTLFSVGYLLYAVTRRQT